VFYRLRETMARQAPDFVAKVIAEISLAITKAQSGPVEARFQLLRVT
jgi:hypothetical protein